MPFKRKTYTRTLQPCSGTIYHSVKTFVPVQENGIVIHSEIVQQLTSEEMSARIPSPEMYDLDTMLKAGVPLQQINTSHMLDNLSVDAVDSRNTSQALHLVQELVSKESTPAVPDSADSAE